MDGINDFVAAQRNIADEERDRERYRDRDRRSDRDRDRNRDHRNRRDRRRERREEEERRDNRSRHRDDYRDTYDEGCEDFFYYNDVNGRNDQYNDERPRHDSGSGFYGNQGGRHRGESRAADKWISDGVTNTVLVKGLPPHVEEKDIRAELMMSNTPVREVRLVKDKMTGASRGFAFVEFQNVSDAQQWMEQNQGELRLLNQYSCSMYYSTPKNDTRSSGMGIPNQSSGQHPPLMGGVIGDWICSKCGVHNFKRREHCFKCNISREESDRGKESDGYDQVGHNPCNTIVLRGLDALTSEESLLAALQKITILPFKSLQVIRDENGRSLSFAFLEMESIAHSTQLLDTVNRLQFPFEVDGKAVMVNFAKNTFSTVMATMGAQWNAQGQQQAGYNGQDYATYEQYYGTEAYQQYCNDYYQQQATADPNSSIQSMYPSDQPSADSTNAAAAVAQAAIQQAQAAKAFNKSAQKAKPEQTPPAETTEEGYTRYPTPDVSTYQYEETSGYYYDPQTGLYYDANSQYYYNATTGEFMYWDGERHTYLPAPLDETAQMQTPAEQAAKQENKQDKKEKVKVAKKIAKDMAKWAKTMNAAKEPSKRINIQPAQIIAQKKEAATADAGFALFERVGQKSELAKMNENESKIMPPPPTVNSTVAKGNTTPGGASGLVASYGDGDDSDNEDSSADDVLDENKLVDFSKMACLLCKRQFPSKEALQRHQQLSDLHKKNLADLRASKGTASVVQSPPGGDSGNIQGQQFQYRDRAKERREKYGAPAPPEVSARNKMPKAPVAFEQPTKMGLGADNVGNKLLQKMGWNAGQGLGKSGQGIVDPLMASRRQAGAGLGSQGSKILVDPEVSTDYRQAAKAQLFARYRELD